MSNYNDYMLSGLVQYDWLVLWYESLHYCPTNEVSNGTDAEDDHVACRLTFEAHEGEGFTLGFCIGEQSTRTLVDEERAYTTCHRTDTCDGSDS